MNIDLEPTPDEARSFAKDAGWAACARMAIKKGYTTDDWRTAMRAFRVFVDVSIRGGKIRKGEGLKPSEVQAWFDAWYTMLSVRRLMALLDSAGKKDLGELGDL